MNSTDGIRGEYALCNAIVKQWVVIVLVRNPEGFWQRFKALPSYHNSCQKIAVKDTSTTPLLPYRMPLASKDYSLDKFTDAVEFALESVRDWLFFMLFDNCCLCLGCYNISSICAV